MTVWRDWEESSVCFIENSDGTKYALTVYAPDDLVSQWTAQAELLGMDYRQLSFSGLLTGGETRDTAKAVAAAAVGRLSE